MAVGSDRRRDDSENLSFTKPTLEEVDGDIGIEFISADTIRLLFHQAFHITEKEGETKSKEGTRIVSVPEDDEGGFDAGSNDV